MGSDAVDSFGPLLKRYRRASRLTQEALARHAGYNVNYISMLERGVRNAPASTVDMLAGVLGLDDTQRVIFRRAALSGEAPPPQSVFGSLLRRYRLATGFTQEQLAERAYLSQRTISELEGGPASMPRGETIDALIAALELSAEDSIALRSVAPRSGGSPGRGMGSATMLPAETTPLVGREMDEAQAIEILRVGVLRLLTLTGPGGVGKTRLALRVAASVAGDFEGGVVFVSLAPVRDAPMVPSAIGAALGLRERSSGPALQRVVEHLRDQEVLLLLDNFEHLLDAATAISELLRSCPRLKVLVTSRAALHLQGEREMEVFPLSLPAPGEPSSHDWPTRYGAIALFIQRARARGADLQGLDASMETIAEICRRLDGLPLAIELAAARVRLFPPRILLDRLSSRLALLGDGPRDLPPRQQTMRGAIDWSHRLLGKEEQVLFARLAVFAGGSTLHAVEAICNLDGDRDVLAGLTELLQHSLLREEGSDEVRFSMLETIREYAGERLDASGEGDRLRKLHSTYFLAMAEAGAAALHGPEASAWIGRLETEHDNLQAALRWARDERELETGLRLASALSRFWELRGTLDEGRASVEALLSLPEPGDRSRDPSIWAKAHAAAGTLAIAQGDIDRSMAHWRRSLDLALQVDDSALTVEALMGLGTATMQRGLHEDAAALLQEALTLARTVGDRRYIAFTLFHLASCLHRHGHVEAARSLFEESLTVGRTMSSLHDLADLLGMMGARVYSFWNDVERREEVLTEELRISRALGDRRSMARSLNNLAWLACDGDDYDRALDLLEESLAVYRELRDVRGTAGQLRYLGWLSRQRGDYMRATQLLDEALRLFREAGDRAGMAKTLLGLGDVARDRGDSSAVKSLCEKALAMIRGVGGTGASEAEGFCLNDLGLAALYEGDYPRAVGYIEQAIALFRSLEADWGPAEILLSLGQIRVAQGDIAAASAAFEKSLGAESTQPPLLIAIMGLEGMATIAVLEDQAERATRLFAAADAFRTRIHFPVRPANRASYDLDINLLRSRLGGAAFTALWQEGATMTRKEAVVYALRDASGSGQDDSVGERQNAG